MKHAKTAKHVLIVERDAMIAHNMAEYLHDKGNQVHVVKTSAEADKVIADLKTTGTHPVVVLSDDPLAVESHMFGVQYLKHLREEQKFKGPIFMLGWPEQSEKAATDLGATKYFSKEDPKALPNISHEIGAYFSRQERLGSGKGGESRSTGAP